MLLRGHKTWCTVLAVCSLAVCLSANAQRTRVAVKEGRSSLDTLEAVIQSHPSPGPGVHMVTGLEPYKLSLQPTGQERLRSPDVGSFLLLWFNLPGHRFYGNSSEYTHEVGVRSGGRQIWMSIPKSLLERWRSRAKDGAPILADVGWVGSTKTQHVFLVVWIASNS
jgi:hypothetical protein